MPERTRSAPRCPDGCDICSLGDDAVDSDSDNIPDACDVCLGHNDTVDSDGDGIPDGCDLCEGSDDAIDTDGDGAPDGCDLCEGEHDTNADDGDGDTVPDTCDVCAGDDSLDIDGDGVPNACDECAGHDDALDADGDNVPDGCDICAAGNDAIDADMNGTPDACDTCGDSVIYHTEPVIWLPLDDDVDDTVYDRVTDSDVGDHGSAVGLATLGPLLGQAAIDLGDSTTESHVIVDTTNTDGFPTEELTVALWARFDDADQPSQHLFSYAVAGTDNEFLISYDGGQLGILLNGASQAISAGGVVSNRWHHIALTYRASDGRLAMYLDGTLQSLNVGSGGSSPLSAGGSLVLGQDQDSVGGSFDANQDFDGDLADVAVWDRTLSADELTALAQSSCARAQTCNDLQDNFGITDSGVYSIRPQADGADIRAYCDMTTDGGGWTMMFHFYDHTSFTETLFINDFGHNLWTDESWSTSAGTFTSGAVNAIAPLTGQGAIDKDVMTGLWDDVRMSCAAAAGDVTEEHFAQVDGYATANGNWDLLGGAANGTSYAVGAASNSMGLTTVWHDNEPLTGNSNHYLCDIHTGGTGSAQFSFCYTDHLNNSNALEQGDSVVALAFGSGYGADGWSNGFTGECGDMDSSVLLDTGTYSLYVR